MRSRCSSPQPSANGTTRTARPLLTEGDGPFRRLSGAVPLDAGLDSVQVLRELPQDVAGVLRGDVERLRAVGVLRMASIGVDRFSSLSWLYHTWTDSASHASVKESTKAVAGSSGPSW